MDRFSELEYKWDATGVPVDHFAAWAMNQSPFKYRRIKAPDYYWVQGENVIRHRHDVGAGTLTVKGRKSSESITDRVEIDLQFGPSVKDKDVPAFLEATGWQMQLWLAKDAHIFWFSPKHASSPQFTSTVALYDVNLVFTTTGKHLAMLPASPMRFLEVEIEKTSSIDGKRAQDALNLWRDMLTNEFKLVRPLNLSLYEIFSGKRYKIIEGITDDQG